MTPTPKLSMQKQIRKKREQKPRCYDPALRRTRAAEHLPPTVICVSCIPDGFAGPSEAGRFFLAHSLLRAYSVPHGFAGRMRRLVQSRIVSYSFLFAYRAITPASFTSPDPSLRQHSN